MVHLAARWELFEPDENVEKLPKGLAPYASPMQTAVPWLAWLITSENLWLRNGQCLKAPVQKSRLNNTICIEMH